MYKAFKYKLKPTKEQEQQLLQMAGNCRFTWNYFLELNQNQYQENKTFKFYIEMNALLTKLKKEKTFLKDTPAHDIKQVLR